MSCLSDGDSFDMADRDAFALVGDVGGMCANTDDGAGSFVPFRRVCLGVCCLDRFDSIARSDVVSRCGRLLLLLSTLWSLCLSTDPSGVLCFGLTMRSEAVFDMKIHLSDFLP